MSFFDDRLKPYTLSGVRGQILGLMQSAGLAVTSWRVTDVVMQMFEAFAAASLAFVSIVPQTIRGVASLETSSDPGDDDPYDPSNINMAPDKGFLSAMGEGTYNTVRAGASFAEGFATFVNGSGSSKTIAPGGLIYTWSLNGPPSPAPTYANANDPMYVGGSLVVPSGTTVTIPIASQVVGSFASAPAASLTLTTSIAGCSGTNPSPVIGNDREGRLTYIDNCRRAISRLSLAGPSAIYEYLATKDLLTGKPILNASGVPSGITRAHVTQSSTTGRATAWFASASGPAISDDVIAANANIEKFAFAVPGCITYTGLPAVPTNIHVAGTAKLKARIGVTAQAAAQGIVASIVAEGSLIDIGGVDQVSGAGVVYTSDIEAYARAGFPGLYDVIATTPGGASTAIPEGHFANLQTVAGNGSTTGDWIVTLVP